MHYKNYTYRKGPVPSVGGDHYNGRYYRQPKTNNERRATAAFQLDSEENFVTIKKNNRARYLVSTYDDIPRFDSRIRSWKNTKKKHQWMK